MAKRSRARKSASRGRADLVQLRRVSESVIARTSPEELAHLPADFWDSAKLVVPVPKQPISFRVDTDVLEWFKHQGPRYQSRMNAVLRSYVARMKASKGQRRRGAR